MLVVLGVCGVWRLTVPDRPVARVVAADSLECRPPYPFSPPTGTPTAIVPDGFEPVRAVTCDPFVQEDVAADRTVGYSERRWEGDFDRVVALLNRSSEHSTWFPGGCSDTYSLAQLDEFWLIDKDGRAVRPGYPTDYCGLPKVDGLAELQQLNPVGSTEYRISLSDSQIYESWNCRPTYQPPMAGTVPPSTLPVGSRFCRFSSETFVGTATTSALLDNLVPAAACSAVAAEVASTSYRDPLSGQEGLLTVELDGCQRVIADGYVPWQASDELLADLAQR